MILSSLCQPVRKGQRSGRKRHKPGKEIFQLEPSVEAIAKFRHIAGKMLFPDRMVRSITDNSR